MMAGKDPFNAILTGQLDKLPPLYRKTIKIFICANPKEFDNERLYLTKEILPELQHQCLQHGMDVIFVDMLLGNPNDPALSHEELEARKLELEACCQESAGVFFLCLVGDEYGTVPLPVTLDDNEYRHIHEEAMRIGKNVRLLDQWYQRDENAIPAVYAIKPRDDNTGKQIPDDTWSHLYTELLDLIQTAAEVCHDEGRINQFNDKRQDRLYTSVFEREIRHALKAAPKRCLFVYRDMNDPNKDTKPSGRSFIASITQTLKDSPRANERMDRLLDEIHSKTSDNNRLHISYFKEGTRAQQDENMINKDYISRLCFLMSNKLTEMVDNTLLSQIPYPEIQRRDFCSTDSLVHLHHCANQSMEPSGLYEKLMPIVQSQLIHGARSEHQLIIVKCVPEYVNDSLTPRICNRAKELFGKDMILIPLFVGLTVSSCTIEDIFRHLCVQLNLVLKQNVSISTYDLDKLSTHFQGLLQRVTKSSRHVVVVLDSIDKLQQGTQQANIELDWLSGKFPPKFHIVVTFTSSETTAMLKKLESKLTSTDNIINVGNLGTEDCQDVLSQTLSQCKRKLTNEQQSSLLKAISAEKSPFIATVMSVLAKTWSSNDTPNNGLPASVEQVVTHTLDSLETRFGVTVVKAVCSYITLSRYGLTELELLDVLACNDDVLTSCYPTGIDEPARFPTTVWVVLKQQLSLLLSERYDYGKHLLIWKFRCCITIVRQRYLSSPEETIKFHEDLANIFREAWSNGKPLNDPGQIKVDEEDTDRMVSPQPLLYCETMYNRRRVRELWFQLLKAGDLVALKSEALCNFEYLLALVDSISIRELTSSLDVVCSLLVDADMHLLRLTLAASSRLLLASPILLANEIIGRLRQVKECSSNYIDIMVNQCMEWCDNYHYPLLVPLTSWLSHVHKPFVASLTELSDITCMVPLSNGQHVILAQGNRLSLYHVASKRNIRHFTGQKGEVTCLALSHSKWQLLFGCSDNSVTIRNLTTDDIILTIRSYDATPTCVIPYKEEVVCGLQNGEIAINSIKTGKLTATLTGHTKTVTGLKLNSVNTILVSASLDKKIILWFTEDWKKLIVVSDSIHSPIGCLDVSVDKTFMLAGCDDGNLHVMSLTTGTIAQTIPGFRSKIQAVSVCKDCHHCLVATSNGTVYLYNFRSMELLDKYEGHTHPVHSLCLSEDQHLVFTASKSEVNVWSCLKRFAKEVATDEHVGKVQCFAITKDNRRLITGGIDGVLKSWNLEASDIEDNYVGHTGPITCLALSDDKTFVVSGSADTTLKVWSLMMSCVITNYKGHTSKICGVHVLSGNGVILSLEIDQKIHMWRPEDGQTIRLYEGPVELQTPSPDGTYFISGDGDHRVQLWNLADGTFVKEFSHTEKISCLSCSLDSKFLVTGSLDNSVKVWEMATGKIVQIMVEHDSTIHSLVMTRDNEFLLSGDETGIIMVCSITLGVAEHKLTSHQDVVTVVKLCEDDAIAISGSIDNTVRVWRYKLGIQLTMFDLHAPVLDIAMTTTADRIAVRLAMSSHVPILCLHNTPSKQRRDSKISFESRPETVNQGDECNNILPIKPRQPARTRLSSVLPIPPARRRLSSVSSMPQIIQHSPIKAPVQSILNANEKKKKDKPYKRSKKAQQKPQLDVHIDERASGVCNLL